MRLGEGGNIKFVGQDLLQNFLFQLHRMADPRDFSLVMHHEGGRDAMSIGGVHPILWQIAKRLIH